MALISHEAHQQERTRTIRNIVDIRSRFSLNLIRCPSSEGRTWGMLFWNFQRVRGRDKRFPASYSDVIVLQNKGFDFLWV